MKTQQKQRKGIILIVLFTLLIPLGTSGQTLPDVYYRFEASGIGTDTLVEDVFGNYPATLQENYVWEPEMGKYGGALRFNGATEVDLAPELEDHIFNQGYRQKTVALWFKADNPANNGMLYYDGPGNNNMGIRLLEGKLQGVVTAGDNAGAPTMIVLSTNINSSDWSHVSLVFDHGKAGLYLNGDLAASGNLGRDTVIQLQQKQARLGYKAEGWSPFRDVGISANAVYNFNGLIDEFMLFTRALDEAEIEEIMLGDTATVSPADPTNLSAIAISYKAVELSWDDNSNNESGFIIQSKNGTGDYQQAAIALPDSGHIIIDNLLPETEYSFKVLAYNLIGNSGESNEAVATTLEAPPAPEAPSNLTGSVVDFKTISIEWSDNSDNEEGFVVLRKKGDETFINYKTLAENTTEFSDSLLDSETQYAYRIFAFNGGGNSDTTDILELTTPVEPAGEGIVFPFDAGVINVKDHGVVGDGIQDDTDALQAILDQYTGIIYFPEGTYLISNTLTWKDPARNITFQGQDKEKVTLKLKDNCEGYQNTVITKSMIWTGEAPAQRFRNYIRDMTFNTGTGNPGAIGLQFIANNAGGVLNVNIISGDGQGMIGLDLGYTNEQGPCLIKNVKISGFAVGISAKGSVDSITMEHIFLENQTEYGIRNSGQCISIRKLTSVNSVPAYFNQGLGSVTTLIDCDLSGGDPVNSAIVNYGVLMARNLSTQGYKLAIDNQVGSKISEEGPNVEEFLSTEVLTLIPTQETSLGLEIKETPEMQWVNNFSEWVNVTKYGAVANDGQDDTEAIQAAIDAGGSVVYFPKGEYHLDGQVIIRGKVQQLMGCESRVLIPQGSEPSFLLGEGESDTVFFERFAHFGYNLHYTLGNTSDRTLVVRNSSAINGKFTGSGDIFLEDVVANIYGQFVFGNQNIWARQLNVETRNGITHIVNDGGNLWVLGYKTENKGTQIHTKNQGSTEVVGGFFYSVGPEFSDPMLICENANMSITVGESNYGSTPFIDLVKQIDDGTEFVLTNAEAPNRGAASVLPLFVARYEPDQVLDVPAGLSAVATSSSSIQLGWTDNDTYEKQYLIERKQEGGVFKMIAQTEVSSSSYLDEDLEAGTLYIYRIKSFTATSTSPYSEESQASTFITGIETNDPGLNPRITPNPLVSSLEISFETTMKDMKIYVFDTHGKLYKKYNFEGKQNVFSIDLSTLNSGIYHLKFQSDEFQVNRAIMKL